MGYRQLGCNNDNDDSDYGAEDDGECVVSITRFLSPFSM